MSDEHAAHGDSHHVNYGAIFGLLCICTALSWIFDVWQHSMSRGVLVTLVLAVAFCKATFVLLYFMHIKFEAGWKYVLLAPTMVLAVCLPFALAPDMTFHYYNVIVPQSYVILPESTGHGNGHADSKHDAAATHSVPASHDEHSGEHKSGKDDGHDHDSKKPAKSTGKAHADEVTPKAKDGAKQKKDAH